VNDSRRPVWVHAGGSQLYYDFFSILLRAARSEFNEPFPPGSCEWWFPPAQMAALEELVGFFGTRDSELALPPISFLIENSAGKTVVSDVPPDEVWLVRTETKETLGKIRYLAIPAGVR
jgi:hypothetical protein